VSAAAAATVEGEGDVGGCRRRRWGPTAATGEGHDGGLKSDEVIEMVVEVRWAVWQVVMMMMMYGVDDRFGGDVDDGGGWRGSAGVAGNIIGKYGRRGKNLERPTRHPSLVPKRNNHNEQHLHGLTTEPERTSGERDEVLEMLWRLLWWRCGKWLKMMMYAVDDDSCPPDLRHALHPALECHLKIVQNVLIRGSDCSSNEETTTASLVFRVLPSQLRIDEGPSHHPSSSSSITILDYWMIMGQAHRVFSIKSAVCVQESSRRASSSFVLLDIYQQRRDVVIVCSFRVDWCEERWTSEDGLSSGGIRLPLYTLDFSDHLRLGWSGEPPVAFSGSEPSLALLLTEYAFSLGYLVNLLYLYFVSFRSKASVSLSVRSESDVDEDHGSLS
ncbi:hypothetical protein Tco_0705655, partial [Tanacetum coccineum]